MSELRTHWKLTGRAYRDFDKVAETVTRLGIGTWDHFFGADDSEPQMELLGNKMVFEKRYIPPGYQTPLRPEVFLQCHTVHNALKLELFRANDPYRVSVVEDLLAYLKELGYAD